MQLAPDQEIALKEIHTGRNVFFTGEAASGKSTIAKEFKRRTSRNCVFHAPTGIVAVNIGGSTIHSFLRLAPGLMSEDSSESIGNKKQRVPIRSMGVIIIDEISMVRSDLFWTLDYRFRQVSQGKSKKQPFGGKQVSLGGDFCQLPPVMKSEEERFIKSTYGWEFVFQTSPWTKGDFKCFCLKNAHRQSNDILFLLILNHIRHNDLESRHLIDPETLEALTVREIFNEYSDTQHWLSVSPVCLCTTNREANTIDALANEKSDDDGHTFSTIVKSIFSEKDYPLPQN